MPATSLNHVNKFHYPSTSRVYPSPPPLYDHAGRKLDAWQFSRAPVIIYVQSKPEPVGAKKQHKKGQPLGHDPTFAGPLTKRSCTDVLCLLVFFAFVAGWVFVAVIAYRAGDPERLIYPTDSLGQRCGVDLKVKNKPNLFFFDLLKCSSPSVIATGCPTPQVCVEKCPQNDFSATFYLSGAGGSLDQMKRELVCTYDVKKEDIKSFTQAGALVSDNKCAPWYLSSTPLAGRCLPTALHATADGVVTMLIHNQNYSGSNIFENDVLNATATIASLASIEEFGERLLQDLTSTWHLILIGLVESAVLSFIYIIIMRWIAAPMIWISLFGSIVMLSYGVYASWERHSTLNSYADSQLPSPSISDVFNGNLESYFMVRETWLALMIICAVLLVVVLLITLFLRSRFRIAIALIREASKAVGSAMSTLFFPIVPWILQLGVLAFGVSVMLFLASSGNPEYRVTGLQNSSCTCPAYKDGVLCVPEKFEKDCRSGAGFTKVCMAAMCSFYQYRSDPHINWFHAYNVFGLFWGIFFVSAFGEMVLAGTFATWYWTYKKSDLPYFTLTGAFLRTIRYHLGTLAFGSLIIAICRMIRVILEWVDRKLKKYSDNKFVQGVMCCCKCCFYCLEKFLRFINRNAYIMCAVHGKNFCTSAREAFFLLMRNVVRVVVLDKVTDFLLFLGKLLIMTAVIVQWFYIFSRRLDPINPYLPNLNYYMAPVIIIGIGTYCIASLFFKVYSTAVDTLFLCFLEDCERNDGSSEKPYYMSSKLMKILNKKNKLE